MLDLKNIKYDRDTLKKHIYEVNLWDILKTQKIDESFAVKYILNSKYQLTESEKCINIDDVLFYQTHLIKEIMIKYMIKIKFSDEDSIKSFDRYT